MSTASESLPCFGKINLFLEIQDRRSDGFHNLGTLFQTVGCADRLSAEPWDGLALDCPPGITSAPEENLVLKAAALLRETMAGQAGPLPGIRFTLEKNLPSGAGLGGGSSDAAGALILCNRIWKLDLTVQQLMPFAARLGADVPFFLHGGSAFGEGKGEQLSPAPSPFPFHVVIGTPECRVETGWAYGRLAPDRKQRWNQFKALYYTYCEDWQFYRILDNDFHAPMRSHFQPIRDLAAAMEAFSPVKTLLSGSGASVFSLFPEKNPAETCLRAIQGQCRFSCLTEFTD